MDIQELITKPSSQQRKALLNKDVSAVELVNAVYDRIDEVEEKIGAYNSLTKDIALQTAETVDEKIKNGEDFVTEDGETVANERITFPPDPVRSYAYCSDTIYMPELEKQLKGIDLLYHEATFCNEDVKRAKETYHTTSGEAAALALKADVKKLLIGHFSARYTDSNQLLRECRSIFRNTVAATEGLTVDI